jgi:predicted neuraminidase
MEKSMTSISKTQTAPEMSAGIVFEEIPIPSPNPQNHAANLCELPGSDLLCVWFSGTQEGMADISIYMSRLLKDRKVWTEPQRMSFALDRSEQNPVLFLAPDGQLWLFWTSQRAGNQDTAVVMNRISSDEGESWSEPKVLIDRPGSFVRQPVVVNARGEWLLPLFRCRKTLAQKWTGDADYSAIALSKNKGASWDIRPLPGSLGCVHMNIIQMNDDSMLAFFRSRWADFIYRAKSTDGGLTWDVPQPTVLPNNNSSIQCVKLKDGRLAMVFNRASAADATQRRESLYDEIEDDDYVENLDKTPGQAGFSSFASAGHENAPLPDSRRAFWGAPRAPLSIAFSEDDGISWPVWRDIEVGDGYCLSNNSKNGLNREYSYPSILQGSDELIHVAYTVFRQRIKYIRFSTAWVQESEQADLSEAKALPKDERSGR